MNEDNPRKKRLGLLKRSRSNPYLAEERGKRATDDDSSSLLAGSRRGLSRFLPKSLDKFARGARRPLNPEPTVAGSSDILPIRTTRHPSRLNASTPRPNPDQSSNSGIAKAESPLDRALQNAASAMGDLQNPIPIQSTSSPRSGRPGCFLKTFAHLRPPSYVALPIYTCPLCHSLQRSQ
ncbi:hypothetical protein EV424DRAFT_1603587 [Suillus variegatus]|nr:hypothetical protein EV424DRAFT_1603587 [Suillus variegatus]